MRIALDAMGGDFAPQEIVAGGLKAAAGIPSIEQVILVGDEKAIQDQLALSSAQVNGKISVRHADEVIDMAESPAAAVRRKRGSSINRAIDLVKDGEADAVVSAGNTGAMVVASTLKLRNTRGCRPPGYCVGHADLEKAGCTH